LQALFCDTIILAASYSKDSTNRWKIFDKKLDSGARLAMEFAKSYNIPRAVMYNKDTDINNPMFDLNRELSENDKTVTVLTQKKLEEIISNIKKNKLNMFNKNNLSTLFDY